MSAKGEAMQLIIYQIFCFIISEKISLKLKFPQPKNTHYLDGHSFLLYENCGELNGSNKYKT